MHAHAIQDNGKISK